MNVKELIVEYMSDVLQLVFITCADNKPWGAPVWYAFDDELNLYFIRITRRRQSVEGGISPYVAGVICKEQKEKAFVEPVRGLQLDGTAEVVEGMLDGFKAWSLYLKRFPQAIHHYKEGWRSLTGTSEFRMYRLRPHRIVLFDEKNFPQQPRQELVLSKEP